jgi:hypothetical protein
MYQTRTLNPNNLNNPNKPKKPKEPNNSTRNFRYPDGSKYTGQWKNGAREGHGLYVYVQSFICTEWLICRDSKVTITLVTLIN